MIHTKQKHKIEYTANVFIFLGERMVVWENLGMRPSANQFAELGCLLFVYLTFLLSDCQMNKHD